MTPQAAIPRSGGARRGLVVLHGIYWIGYALQLLGVLTVLLARIRITPGSSLAPLRWTLIVSLTLPNIVAFYASDASIFPLLADRRPWPVLMRRGLAVCGVSGFLAFAVLYAGARAPRLPLSELPAFATLLICLMVFAAVHAFLALGVRGFASWYGDIREREERERRAHALELELLRSRLDPHFLFNTLNNIDFLIDKDRSAASAYLHKMSDLMRYVLFEATPPRVPLTMELAHMARYMEVEALRHADAEFASLEVTGDPAGISVPPTIFMPFIENAFKHGARTEGARVRVRCDVAGAQITFVCINQCRIDDDAMKRSGGLGQALVERRLELLYPGRHELELTRADGKYRVSVTIRI